MKIFILFPNEHDDLSTLPADAEKIVVFKFIKGAPNIAHLQKRLAEVLDTADVHNDFIVFNGPSYLCALAGYVWLSNEDRTNVNFYAYNVKDTCYVKHTEKVDA